MPDVLGHLVQSALSKPTRASGKTGTKVGTNSVTDQKQATENIPQDHTCSRIVAAL